MTPFDPAKAFQQVRDEKQREREAAAEWGRRTSEAWAAYDRRLAVLYQLIQSFPCDTAEVGRVTSLMIDYAQTLPREWLKARLTFVRERLTKLAADGEAVPDAGLEDILLNLVLLAGQGDHAKVADIFTEALCSHPHDVTAFRWCLVSWMIDKVVERMPPLPVEVIAPVEASAQSEDGQEPVDLGAAPVESGVCDTVAASADKGRLHFDPQTQTVTLDGKDHKIEDPKAFSLYQVIASSCSNPLTKAILQERVPGCRGDKKIRQLLNGLPKLLCNTVRSGPNGYWLDLNPPPKRGKRSRSQKGRA